MSGNGIWEGSPYHEYADYKLLIPEAINLETVGQYYKIPGTYLVWDEACFSVTEAGIMTYNGVYGTFLLNGVSDAQVNKSCFVTYASYINGEVYSTTIHQFTASSKAEAIATTAIAKLYHGDTYEIYAKSDTANTLLTPTTLKVTFFGARR
jgi:hypothetical protein